MPNKKEDPGYYTFYDLEGTVSYNEICKAWTKLKDHKSYTTRYELSRYIRYLLEGLTK